MVQCCVPSWVIPGSVAANAAFLRGKAHAVMLCAFEHAPLLPVELPETPSNLHWHVHLPTDLPWTQGGRSAGAAACCIMDQARRLVNAHSLAVLHPPHGFSLELSAVLLQDFRAEWESHGWPAHSLLLENQPDAGLESLLTLAEAAPLDLCLDVAHLALSGDLTHGMLHRLPRDQVRQIRMMHWAAPRNGKDAHAPLTQFTRPWLDVCRELAVAFPHAVDVLEVFDWPGVLASWDRLRTWKSGNSPS